MAFIKRDLFGNLDVPTDIFRRWSRPKYIVAYATPPDWGIPVKDAPPLHEGVAYSPCTARLFAFEYTSGFDARTASLPDHTGVVAVYANKDKPELLASYQYGDTLPEDIALQTIKDHCTRHNSTLPVFNAKAAFYVQTPKAGITPKLKKTAAVIHPDYRTVLWAAESEKSSGLKLGYK